MVDGARAHSAHRPAHHPAKASHCNPTVGKLGREHITRYGVLMRPPSECRNMAELRDQIDRLDRKLVGLFSERAAYIDRAAELKPAEGLPARINSRVTEVRNNVRAEALAQGWDPELADSLWSQLIDWSIAREEKILGQDEQE